MFRIKYLPQKDVYQIHSRYSGAFEGTLEAVIRKALQMGMEQDELTFACLDMAENKTLVAEFGVRGKFLFSHKKVA